MTSASNDEELKEIFDFSKDEMSWEQFGGCTQEQLNILSKKWFPNQDIHDIAKIIKIQRIWKQHPIKLQTLQFRLASSAEELKAIYDFSNGTLSWEEIGECTQEQLNMLSNVWFPDSKQDIVKIIKVQDIWNRYPKRLQTMASISAPGLNVISETELMNVWKGGTTNLVNNCELLVDQMPPWLRLQLPRRLAELNNESIVDLSLPVDCNPFYVAMKSSLGDSEMMRGLHEFTDWRTRQDHVLLVGSSGCGKTSAILNLATSRFTIYLECASSHFAKDCQRGYRMNKQTWIGETTDTFDVKCFFYIEVAARLLVLYRMLEEHGEKLTPLQWLLYCLSDDGDKQIGTVVSSLYSQKVFISPILIVILFKKVSSLPFLASVPPPIIAVDELQRYGKLQVNYDGERMSCMNAVVKAANVLSCPVIWSGTRVGITATGGPDSGIAKHYGNSLLGLQVLGDFKYLTSSNVHDLFNSIFVHSASPATIQQLCYLLQGRARMLTSFVTTLLSPPTLTAAELTDEIISDALEEYMNTMVLGRFKTEITHLRTNNLLSEDALGHIWCKTMLQLYDEHRKKSLDHHYYTNSLAFTSHALKNEDPDNNGEVRYSFQYEFGEPGLQEALLRIVWEKKGLADLGIRQLLGEAYNGGALGCYLVYSVALALIARRQTVLSELCTDHTQFSRLGGYELHISRVVMISSVEQQLEWMQRVLADPNDCNFSLLQGVPVKNIAILPSVLSGADFICVATHIQTPSPPGSSSDSVVSTSGLLPSTSTIPYYLRTKKRRKIECEPPSAASQSMSPQDTLPGIVFVNICCATYKDGVTNTKHEKNVTLSREQFLNYKGGAYGKTYRRLVKENQGKIEYLPVLVEIPRIADATPSSEYIHITEENATKLFRQEVIDALVNRSNVIG